MHHCRNRVIGRLRNVDRRLLIGVRKKEKVRGQEVGKEGNCSWWCTGIVPWVTCYPQEFLFAVSALQDGHLSLFTEVSELYRGSTETKWHLETSWGSQGRACEFQAILLFKKAAIFLFLLTLNLIGNGVQLWFMKCLYKVGKILPNVVTKVFGAIRLHKAQFHFPQSDLSEKRCVGVCVYTLKLKPCCHLRFLIF